MIPGGSPRSPPAPRDAECRVVLFRAQRLRERACSDDQRCKSRGESSAAHVRVPYASARPPLLNLPPLIEVHGTHARVAPQPLDRGDAFRVGSRRREREQMKVRRHRAHELEPRAARTAEVRDERGHRSRVAALRSRAPSNSAGSRASLRGCAHAAVAQAEQGQRQARQDAKPATTAHFDTDSHELRLSSAVAERTMNANERKSPLLFTRR